MSAAKAKKISRHYLSPEEAVRFREDARTQGMTVEMLAELHDLHTTTVRNHLRKLGIVTQNGTVLVKDEPVVAPTVTEELGQKLIKLGQMVGEADRLAQECGFKISIVKL